MTRIAITGVGILSAAGRGLADTAAALRECRSGLGELTRFASPRNGHLPVAEVAGENLARYGEAPRTLALAQDALHQAIEGADLGRDALASTGLVLGTCVAGMPETEAAIARAHDENPERERFAAHVDLDILRSHECGSVTNALASKFGVHGPVTTISTACSSSAQALAAAADLIDTGCADIVLAGGADALSRLTLNGFASLLNVSPDGCRPFDANRTGMSLGEGAGFLVLESSASAARRGVSILGVLTGHGNTCDAHHATAPHPDGLGAEAAMQEALRMAGLSPADVDYVNAHGTGTTENDSAEGRALDRVFGGAPPPISSTKQVFGHTLGAAGAIEAVVALLAIRDGFLPGTAGLVEPDPACVVTPLRETLTTTPNAVLSNSFGFGGNNTSLCFQSTAVLS